MKDFDQLLDGVLREAGKAEPLAGMEERVMRRVQTASQRRSGLRWADWRSVWWGMAVAVPICFVALLIWSNAAHGPTPGTVGPGVASAPARVGGELPKRTGAEHVEEARSETVREEVGVRPGIAKLQPAGLVLDRAAHGADLLPKLDVFPTPSVADGPVLELAEVARGRSVRPGLVEFSLEEEGPVELRVRPITIARIEIAPLFPVTDAGAKEVEGR